MLNKIKINKPLIYKEWKITEVNNPIFKANNGDYVITFEVEYKYGMYDKIKGVYDINKNRYYTAERYFYKYIPLIREIAFDLLKNNLLWDYVNNCTALTTYKKDIAKYYYICKEKGLSLYGDTEFLDSLFEEDTN
jgi:hypothetical protein